MPKLVYREVDHKYVTVKPYRAATEILGYDIRTEYITLDSNGVLTIDVGWGWNGASGPTIDSPYTMLPAAEHDAFYTLIALGFLPLDLRPRIDQFLRDRLVECGYEDIKKDPSTGIGSSVRNWWRRRFVRRRADAWLLGVSVAGESAAEDDSFTKIKTLEYR